MGHRAVVLPDLRSSGGKGRLIRDLSCDDTPFRAPTKALTMRAVCMFSSSMLSKRQFVKLIGCNLSKCFQMWFQVEIVLGDSSQVSHETGNLE